MRQAFLILTHWGLWLPRFSGCNLFLLSHLPVPCINRRRRSPLPPLLASWSVSLSSVFYSPMLSMAWPPPPNVLGGPPLCAWGGLPVMQWRIAITVRDGWAMAGLRSCKPRSIIHRTCGLIWRAYRRRWGLAGSSLPQEAVSPHSGLHPYRKTAHGRAAIEPAPRGSLLSSGLHPGHKTAPCHGSRTGRTSNEWENITCCHRRERPVPSLRSASSRFAGLLAVRPRPWPLRLYDETMDRRLGRMKKDVMRMSLTDTHGCAR